MGVTLSLVLGRALFSVCLVWLQLLRSMHQKDVLYAYYLFYLLTCRFILKKQEKGFRKSYFKNNK